MRRSILKLTLLAAALFVLASCTISYKFNQSSIDYSKVKTITIENFTNRAAFQWAPMASMLNTSLIDKYANQTKLVQTRRDGDLVLSGEITSYDQTNKSISADGYSAMVQLKMTVKVKFTNNKDHSDDFERSFSSTREYDSSQSLQAVQEQLVQEMIDDIVDQVFNESVAKW
mgnify:CR=1 FL=1